MGMYAICGFQKARVCAVSRPICSGRLCRTLHTLASSALRMEKSNRNSNLTATASVSNRNSERHNSYRARRYAREALSSELSPR